MNQFVEECRREWKRLRVPDGVADEMAADLAADLDEAEADGASPEDVLGSSASDPRSFAASWAAERAVIPPPLRRRSLIHLALAALTLIAAIGAALVIFASPDASAPPAAIRLPPPAPYPINVSFDNDRVARVALVTREAELAHEHAAFLAQLPKGSVWVQSNGGIVLRLPQAHDPGVEIHTVGSILLIAGIAGMIFSMLFLFWSSRAGPDHGSRRQVA